MYVPLTCRCPVQRGRTSESSRKSLIGHVTYKTQNMILIVVFQTGSGFPRTSGEGSAGFSLVPRVNTSLKRLSHLHCEFTNGRIQWPVIHGERLIIGGRSDRSGGGARYGTGKRIHWPALGLFGGGNRRHLRCTGNADGKWLTYCVCNGPYAGWSSFGG